MSTFFFLLAFGFFCWNSNKTPEKLLENRGNPMARIELKAH